MVELLVSLPALSAILSYHLGVEGDMRTVSGRAPEPVMMQPLYEVSQASGLNPKLRAHAKILSCFRTCRESGWKVVKSAVMFEGLMPVRSAVGSLPYQHWSVAVTCLGWMRVSSIWPCLKAIIYVSII